MAHRLSIVALALAGVALYSGCMRAANDPTPPAAPVTAAPATHFTDEQIQSFALLPPEERAAAEKQAICPVSEEGLGTHGMGMPYKITLQNAEGQDHTFYLCCKGCEGLAKKDPVGTLAKLPKSETR